MAYKFFQGSFKTNGALDVNNALTGNALLVDTGGITVSTGASSLQELTASTLKVDNTLLNGDILSGLTQLSSSNLSASAAQFGTVTVSVNFSKLFLVGKVHKLIPKLFSFNIFVVGLTKLEGVIP